MAAGFSPRVDPSKDNAERVVQLRKVIGCFYGTLLGSILYCFGSFGSSILGQTFTTWAQIYYVDLLKMPLRLYAVAMFIYGVWNAINDPLAGQLSDMTRSRYGRRIPYILFGIIPFGIAFVLLWRVPGGLIHSAAGLFAYFLGMAFLFDGLFTVVILNWTALYPEMYPRLEQRAYISALRQALGIVGMIVGMVLAPLVRARLGWGGMGFLFGGLGIAAMFLSLLGSRERPEFSESQGLNIWQSLRYTFMNRSFVTFVLVSFFVQFTFVLIPATIPFYSKYVMGISDKQNTLLLAPIFVVALPMVWIWGAITNRIGPRRTTMAALVLFMAGIVPYWFVHSLVSGMIASALLGIGLSGLMILIDVPIADVVDDDETRTGVRREGMYFGANAFMVRLGISLEAIVFSLFMDVAGYKAGLPHQPAAVVPALKLLMTVVPIASLALALVALYYYPIHGERRHNMLASLEVLHRQKVESLGGQ